ncbi:MAG: PhnD/SsuA/transferrin family substrate-binding protein [Gammaproteobacteria bacterium]|nr:PhnD/SsuA/transferrin family substrate-binding protein [Gammaproteobacteria bacterium]
MLRRWFTVAIFMALLVPAWAAASPVYTILAPPRQTHAQSEATFAPIAALLTKATGVQFRFHFTRDWLVYMQEVHDNTGAVYFDGPAFIGWRAAKYHDRAAARLNGHLMFVLVVKKGLTLKAPDRLAGAQVCAFSPPNLGTLVLESLFPNPDRQPYIHVIHSLKSGLAGVLKGTCRAVLVPKTLYMRFDKAHPGALSVAYQAKPLANQGFSLSSALPRPLQEKVIAALTSPQGQAATAKLRALFGNRPLVRAHTASYLPAQHLLDTVVGFSG